MFKDAIKKRSRSKTYRVAVFLAAIMAPVEVSFHLLQNTLGDYYGVSFIIVGIVMAGLREVTNTALEEK